MTSINLLVENGVNGSNSDSKAKDNHNVFHQAFPDGCSCSHFLLISCSCFPRILLIPNKYKQKKL